MKNGYLDNKVKEFSDVEGVKVRAGGRAREDGVSQNREKCLVSGQKQYACGAHLPELHGGGQ